MHDELTHSRLHSMPLLVMVRNKLSVLRRLLKCLSDITSHLRELLPTPPTFHGVNNAYGTGMWEGMTQTHIAVVYLVDTFSHHDPEAAHIF